MPARGNVNFRALSQFSRPNYLGAWNRLLYLLPLYSDKHQNIVSSFSRSEIQQFFLTLLTIKSSTKISISIKNLKKNYICIT